MQATTVFCLSVVLAFICLNLNHNINVSALPAAEEDIAGILSAAGTAEAMEQQKPMLSLLRADKLDFPADADKNVDLAGVEAAAALHAESGSRQTRQVILPYGGYPRYYGGYPYTYPYSYSYRPYYYYKPVNTYGYPFYLYG